MKLSERADLGELVGGVAVVASLAMFLALEDQFYQAQHGTLDPEIYAAYVWWQQLRPTFSPSFVDRIDATIAATPEADPGVFLREWQRIARLSEPAA